VSAEARTEMPGELLLDVRGLSISAVSGAFRKTITVGTELTVAPGETVGIVGESGSGKSLTARAIVRLLPPDVVATGSVLFGGTDLMQAPHRRLRAIRGRRLSMMFQDPFTMLNPLLRCGKHIEEMLTDEAGRRGRRRRRKEESLRRLAEVGITDPDVAGRYPFQLSGGMRQRVALAAALARDPELLIADEPTTALDVTTQAEILQLLKSVQQARGMGLLLITHDLRVAFSACDRVYVLYAGSELEVGTAAEVEGEPLHPYTLGLLLSEPPAERRMRELVAIPGSVPSPDEVATMCAFAPRCRWAQDVCRATKPALSPVGSGRLTACVRIHDIRDEMAALRDQALGRGLEAAVAAATARPVLRIEGLVKTFRTGRTTRVEALKGVSLEVAPGESVGLVGESGSGKTTVGRCVVGLEAPTAGSIEIEGTQVADYGRLSSEGRAKMRRTVQMIFQDPYSTLNPRHSVGRSLWEAIRVDRDGQGSQRSERRKIVEELLRRVGLPPSHAARRPSALSGGERQRVAIARALSVQPALIVCDEPVSALDVSVQAQVLNLLKSLQREYGIGYLFISHDLAVVRQMADRVYVLYRGEIVEAGPTGRVMADPQHWYTRRLIESIPASERQRVERAIGTPQQA
jgi:peptide/nickel transport system ATP-binding protein